MILLIDNYDSFVFNLARYFREMGQETAVVRNDRIGVAEIERLRPAAIVLSPGPCTPNEAGVCVEVVRALSKTFPMLGVCLGHQAIAAAFGGKVVRAAEPMHGRASPIHHDGAGLFEDLPNPVSATRYHSLIVDAATLPRELAITARTPDGVPMALAHRALPILGVQFHPESVLTDCGHRLLRNFLRIAGCDVAEIPTGEFAPLRDDDGETLRSLPQPLHW
jgi:anthranilate synthase/aminodeoxychorismate synthase-like glutamine amidotransferase